MNIKTIDTIIHCKDKHTALKAIVYLKLIEYDMMLPDNMVNVLSSFSYTYDKKEVIKTSLEKGWVNSWQSGENCVSRLVKKNLLKKEGGKRVVNPKFLPFVQEQYLAANLKIHNCATH